MNRLPTFLPTAGVVLTLIACQPGAGPEAAGEVRWTAPLEVDAGQAYQGPWRMNESEFRYVDDPAVALTDNGTAMAWVDNAAMDVMFRPFDADGEPILPRPVNVSQSPDVFSWLPRVAVAGDTVIVAWQEILFTGGSHGGEILVARSTEGGRNFSEPVNLSETTAGAGKGRLDPRRWDNGSLDLLVAGDTVIVAWTEYEGALRVAVSEDGGASFGQPQHVTGDQQRPARAPALAVGPDGRTWLAWTVGDDDSADIHLAGSDDPGRGFDPAERIEPSDDHDDSPALAVAASGAIHLAWTRSDGAPFRNSRVLHVRAGDSGFESPTELSGDDGGAYPQLAVAGERVLAGWEIPPARGRRPVGIGHALSTDGGHRFSAARTVPGTARSQYGVNGGNQGLLMRKLDLADDGRVALGHATWLEGQASQVWLLHGRIAGDNDRH